jgi:hypothetical protein
VEHGVLFLNDAAYASNAYGDHLVGWLFLGILLFSLLEEFALMH